MFTNILLAADGSECALGAATVAATCAKKLGARLSLLNVYHPLSPLEPYGEPHDASELDFIGTRQDETLCAAGRIVDDLGVAYRTRRGKRPAGRRDRARGRGRGQ